MSTNTTAARVSGTPQPDGSELIKAEVGKTYEVRHCRKGTFTLRVTAINGEWITGEIVAGVAKAVMSYSVGYEGDSITVRDSHCYFIPVPNTAVSGANGGLPK